MEWRKLKNIILIILVVLNVALLALIGGPKLENSYQTAQGSRNAEIFLEQKGIDLSNAAIPDPQVLLPMVVERDTEEEARLAGQLLGEETQQENRGGEVYRYTSALGAVQFHSDGSFWAQLTPEQFPVGRDPKEAALAVLELLGFSGSVTAQEENSVTVCQQWESARLFSQQATVLWNGTGITEITGGRRLYGTPVADSGRQTIDRPTALIDFYNGLNRLGDVCSRVDAITPGYTSAVSLNKLTTLTPVWRITTDTGVYQLDLVSGSLDRVS